ncbi:hypothetical protein [Vibrio sp. SCSIO 43136]|uniref:hypothetical protein n=1 Tax=Vibrio sp. SCSIO 43136 TaxID=2819101 RepID=UPI002074C0AF|nr:hypothetical protein [Vibrio sp. SCSIO 43136]USD64205.1 hypothetical protein J4N39_08785 [Vibrio sp. SCSIO 43136]
MNKLLVLLATVFIGACGTLDDRTILINAGDAKQTVIDHLGVPFDRQFQGDLEAWQYCVSGAGFGYNDHKIVWFHNGVVSGISTYSTTASGCESSAREIRWKEAPYYTGSVTHITD